MNIRPIARGLHVCERIESNPSNRNISLVGCFDGIRAPRFPSPPQQFAVYATLTGGLGSVKMKVMVSRLMDNRMVYARELPVDFRDRVDEMRFVLRLEHVVFPVPGQYVVELLADG